ncbi:MAG: hypothetical protein HY429_00045 [Candidatus Levybacteria bacterium]|nr:hypothetical protein [Candidatus Levybacteria bacterium]
MHEINLLSHKRETRSKRVVTILRVTSIASLVIVFLSSLILFLVQLQSPLGSLQKEEESLLLRLEQSKEKIEKFIVMQDRLKNISPILKKRSLLYESIDFITRQISPGVSMTTFSISKDILNVGLYSQSVLAANTFFNKIQESVEKKQVLTKATLDNFVVDKEKSAYIFSIKADLIR